MVGPDVRALRAYYRHLSDDTIAELHAAGSGAYLPATWAILDEEFRTRGRRPRPQNSSFLPSGSSPLPRYHRSSTTELFGLGDVRRAGAAAAARRRGAEGARGSR
jgi:hypothetical protein